MTRKKAGNCFAAKSKDSNVYSSQRRHFSRWDRLACISGEMHLFRWSRTHYNDDLATGKNTAAKKRLEIKTERMILGV